MADIARFRLGNFVHARASSLEKFEIVGKTVTYNPNNPSSLRRAEALASRARHLGVPYEVEAGVNGNKITFTGRRKEIRRVFDPTLRSSTRRSSSGKRRSTTRRRQHS